MTNSPRQVILLTSKDFANAILLGCRKDKKKMNAQQFNEKYGKNALDVLTMIYSTASTNPIAVFNYSRLLNQDIYQNVDISPRTLVDVLDRLENDKIIQRQFNAKYRQIFVNENMPNETQVLLKNNLKRLSEVYSQKQTQLAFA